MTNATDVSQQAGPNITDALGTLFQPMGSNGVYARTQQYEDVVLGLRHLISQHRPQGAEVFHFPPVMSRAQLESSGYLYSFPQLLGCVCCLHGTEKDISAAVERAKKGDDWTSETMVAADLVLTPAACYPIYPIAAKRGPVPTDGYVFDVSADCFRREPSQNLDRLQSFRMREYVRIGTPDAIIEFRQEWIEHARGLADELHLAHKIEHASDPFFGRTGQLLALNQIEKALKFELLIPVRSQAEPTACMSFNYHLDHFAHTWNLAHENGTPAHTGCVAFGIDRLALALFAKHGFTTSAWPASIRQALALL